MQKPILFTVDDDPQVLSAVERDLRKHYGGKYRIVKSTSGAEALDAVQKFKRRNSSVALFLIDQRMPNMSGTEFISEAMKLYPQAKKVLLTAYADTEAAIASINKVGLDYYLLKPWDPPEQNLYPVLDDLLDDWQATVPVPYEGIRVAGTLWSSDSHTIKDFLARNLIPYKWLDIEKDEEARLMVENVQKDNIQLPVVFLPDGNYLVKPSMRDLASKVGLYAKASQPFYDLIIVGAGPAGLAAAVYGASEGLRTILIEKEATGGQAGTSSRIENYLGFPQGVSGADLARRATTQARRLGAEILTAEEVTGLRIEDNYRIVRLSDGDEISCHTLLIAVGVTVRTLDVPGIQDLTGAGVYYGAALTEAAYYRDQEIFTVGGGNSAGQAAMFFSRYASRVTMLVRTSSLDFGMSRYLIDQIESTENIRVLFDTEVVEAEGRKHLERIKIVHRNSGDCETLPAAALFIFIGAVTHTHFLDGVVEKDRSGFIYTGPDLFSKGQRPRGWNLKRDPFLLETNVPGVFAAGDVRHGSVKRVASAVGEGAISVALVHQYLKTV
jgi:thioredoxin reductase (NADPH)